MKNIGKLAFLGAVAALAVSLTATAHAVTISGTVWDSQTGNVPTSTAGLPAGDLAATFTTTALHFCVLDASCTPAFSGVYTLQGFLNTNTAPVTGITYSAGDAGTDTLNNTLWEFTGTAFFTNGQTFTVSHDDGVCMYVGGSPVLCSSVDRGPTSPVTSTYTYTGATGSQSFDFIYGETHGAPAVFETTLANVTSTVPEPNSLILLGTGIFGAAGMMFRRLRQTV